MLNPPLGERLGLDVATVYAALIDAKTRALRRHGLSVARYAVLGAVHESGGSSGADLARVCGVTPQSMSETLTALEREGLIERIRADAGRSTITHLTDRGLERLLRADRDAGAIELGLANVFSATEREDLRELLAKASTFLSGTID